MLGHAMLSAVRAFTELATPPDVFVASGHLVALAGLLGLYPVLADRTPTVARAAGGTLVAGFAGWLVMTVTQLLVFAGVATSMSAVLPEPVFVFALASTILAYGLFGVGVLRMGSQSTGVALLVLAPGGMLTSLIVLSAAGVAGALSGVAIGGGLAVSMLALGYTLRTVEGRHDRTTTVGDATSG